MLEKKLHNSCNSRQLLVKRSEKTRILQSQLINLIIVTPCILILFSPLAIKAAYTVDKVDNLARFEYGRQVESIRFTDRGSKVCDNEGVKALSFTTKPYEKGIEVNFTMNKRKGCKFEKPHFMNTKNDRSFCPRSNLHHVMQPDITKDDTSEFNCNFTQYTHMYINGNQTIDTGSPLRKNGAPKDKNIVELSQFHRKGNNEWAVSISYRPNGRYGSYRIGQIETKNHEIYEITAKGGNPPVFKVERCLGSQCGRNAGLW